MVCSADLPRLHLHPSRQCALLCALLIWSECSVLGGRPATCAPHGPGAVPCVPGPTATARIDPTWRPSTEAESPGGTYLSANERREAHHVHTWMRSYPRDPTDPPIPHPTIALLLELQISRGHQPSAKFSLLFVPVLASCAGADASIHCVSVCIRRLLLCILSAVLLLCFLN